MHPGPGNGSRNADARNPLNHVTRIALAAAAAAGFVLLATANGAGYRFGASDQAFYVPAVLRALDPHTFPRDRAIIDVQAHLFLLDDLTARVMRATGLSLEVLYLLGYIGSLLLVLIALALIARELYRSRWAGLALVAAVTLRHRIPQTSANSLEPYFHPRMLAFGLGALAIATYMRRQPRATVALAAASLAVHVTTGLWFAILLGVAFVGVELRSRRIAVAITAAAAVIVAVAAAFGPLRNAWTVMDPTWLQAVSTKDSLFPTTWPVWVWVTNLSFLGLLLWAHYVRARSGRATRQDTGLILGAGALVAIFLVTLPAVAAHISFFVQFQISRVFWIVEFLAVVYLIAAMDDAAAVRSGWAGRILVRVVAGALLTLSVARGVYIMRVERPERALFAVRVPPSPWHDAMDWLERQPLDVYVLADPDHAAKYGTSVRVPAERDVLVEASKDSAMGIYSRDVAHAVVERLRAIGNFAGLDAARARALAKRYGLDYLVTEADLPLKLVYRNSKFRIYELGSRTPRGAIAARAGSMSR